MNLPIKTKERKHSLQRRLMSYLLLLAILVIASLLVCMSLFGRLRSPKEEVMKTMDFQLRVFSNDMSTLETNLSVMGTHLSEALSETIEEHMTPARPTLSHFTGDPESLKSMQEDLLPILTQYLRQSSCSGVFAILNTSVRADQTDYQCGMYIQKEQANRLMSDLLLFRGMADVGKAQGIMPHRMWKQEFYIPNIPDFNRMNMDSDLPLAQRFSVSDTTNLPAASERIMLVLLPLLDSNGVQIGLCGFELNQTWFESCHVQPAMLDRMACLLTKNNAAALNVSSGLIVHGDQSYLYLPDQLTLESTDSNGLQHFTSPEGNLFGVSLSQSFLEPDSDFTLSVLIPELDYHRIIFQSQAQLVLLILLLLFFLISVCTVIHRRCTAPLLQSLEQLKRSEDVSLSSGWVEFDDVFFHLAQKKLEHDQQVQQLEERSLSLLEQEQRLKNQMESLRLERDNIQAELKRLVYNRKTETDPELLEHFRSGLTLLTSKELELIQAYRSGLTIKAAAASLSLSENTAYSYNKNIYRTLGVHSIKELLRYMALIDPQ